MLKVVVGAVVAASGAEGLETSEVVSEAVGAVVSESHEVVVEEVETVVVLGVVAVTGAVAVIEEALVAGAEDLETDLLQETLGTDHHLETLGIGPLLGTLGTGPLLETLMTEGQETALMTDVGDPQGKVFHPGEVPLTEMVEVLLLEEMMIGTGLLTVTDMVVHLKDVAEITPRRHHPGA